MDPQLIRSGHRGMTAAIVILAGIPRDEALRRTRRGGRRCARTVERGGNRARFADPPPGGEAGMTARVAASESLPGGEPHRRRLAGRGPAGFGR